jgi:TATA-binding protein-associated factor Taf7
MGSGNYNERIEGDYVQGNYYASEQKQTLAETAEEIQRLLKQLEETNPTATIEQQQAFVDAAVSPTLKARFLSALQAGWKEAVKEFLDNPYVNVGVAILEGWQEAE